MSKRHAIPGEHLVYCDIGHHTVYASQTVKVARGRQKGLIVCHDHYEEPHPSDFPIPAVTDDINVKDARPRPTFSTESVSIDGHSTWEEYLNV